MNNSNYTVFEILKYKIDFLECIEYSLPSYTENKDEIEKRFSLLKKDFKDGLYNQIVSTLFTSFKRLNEPISKFLSKYNYKKIIALHKKKKISSLLEYNEYIIDAYETLSYILNAFLEEEQIVKLLDKRLIELINLNNEYFINFLFFNCYNLYLEFDHEDFKHTKKDMERTIKLLNYCNKSNTFDKEIEILKDNDSDKIYKTLEQLSNKCSKLEQKQVNDLKEFINFIQNEIHK